MTYIDSAKHNKEIRRAIFRFITNSVMEKFHDYGASHRAKYGRWIETSDFYPWMSAQIMSVAKKIGVWDVFDREDFDRLFDIVEKRITALPEYHLCKPKRSEFSDGMFAIYG